jgi:hypothetical protein
MLRACGSLVRSFAQELGRLGTPKPNWATLVEGGPDWPTPAIMLIERIICSEQRRRVPGSCSGGARRRSRVCFRWSKLA